MATLVLEEHPEMASPEQRAAMFDILRDVGFTLGALSTATRTCCEISG